MPAATFSFLRCRQQDGSAEVRRDLRARLQRQARRHARHMVVAVRVLFTLVAECVALWLRALLPRIARCQAPLRRTSLLAA